jgi:hypothetical protein
VGGGGRSPEGPIRACCICCSFGSACGVPSGSPTPSAFICPWCRTCSVY